MASDRSGLTPHRRKHWSVEPAAPPETPREDTLSPEETRVEAKRLLWRDSAIILIGIILALLAAQLLPRSDSELAADATDLASGPGAGISLSPASSAEPDATFGPIVDPSLRLDATRPPSLPPTGTFKPVETDHPTPKPTKRPAATIGPPTPPPTPEPTPEPTPAPPVASFDWHQEELTTAVAFTDLSTGPIDTWSWDFGDGTSTSEQHPTHVFDAIGLYEVTLTVTGPGGSSSVMQPIMVVGV
jgi:PKD domain